MTLNVTAHYFVFTHASFDIYMYSTNVTPAVRKCGSQQGINHDHVYSSR